MKSLVCILLALCLALGLCACGGSAPAAAPAESAPAENTPAESTPGESGSGCSHEWAPATYALPETCTICGETQGEPKPTCFAENGLTALPMPGDGEEIPLTYLTYATEAPEIMRVRDNGIATFSQSVGPAQEEGYLLVTLNIMVTFEITGDDSSLYSSTTTWNNGLYDLYTGRKVPGRSIMSDDGFSYEAELTVDDAAYLVRYDKTNEWETSPWIDMEGGGTYRYKWCYQTLSFLLPEGYDGLVYALIPALKVPDDSDYEEISGSEIYVTDLTPEELAGTAFFRVGV